MGRSHGCRGANNPYSDFFYFQITYRHHIFVIVQPSEICDRRMMPPAGVWTSRWEANGSWRKPLAWNCPGTDGLCPSGFWGNTRKVFRRLMDQAREVHPLELP